MADMDVSTNETPAASTPLAFTEQAVEKIVAALAEENENRRKQGADEARGLRVAVVGGGCAGFQYSLDFEAEGRAGDTEWDAGGFQVFVDRFSLGYISGCRIDWATSAMGSGFKFENPNVTTTCGCGSSFA